MHFEHTAKTFLSQNGHRMGKKTHQNTNINPPIHLALLNKKVGRQTADGGYKRAGKQ
jgi:hypothetical protein